AAVAPPGCHVLPRQSNTEAAGGCASHQGVRSAVSPTFVNIVFLRIASMRFGLVFALEFDATQKNPTSGLIAYSLPSALRCSHAMSSPKSHTLKSLRLGGGLSIARLVLPLALGNAPLRYVSRPEPSSIPTINICSASHPSSLAATLAILSEWDFLERRAFPP